jgi:hypothetical protein
MFLTSFKKIEKFKIIFNTGSNPDAGVRSITMFYFTGKSVFKIMSHRQFVAKYLIMVKSTIRTILKYIKIES